jgi:hypothetical protein
MIAQSIDSSSNIVDQSFKLSRIMSYQKAENIKVVENSFSYNFNFVFLSILTKIGVY